MRIWALIEAGDSEAIDMFVRREDAEDALAIASRMSRSGEGCFGSRSSSLAARPSRH
jgi:hypothetical protein